MTIPNYLALYNLSQIEADILIVADLTATTGTIYTFNSTTGTITTLNTTTGNITTLNTTTANITTLLTDLWRGTSAGSSMVIGVIGDTGTLTSYRSLIMDTNKTITLNATGGKILCNVYTGIGTSSNLTLGESGDTGNLDIFKTITSSNTYSGNNTYSGTNTFTTTNTFNGNLLCNTFRGTAIGNAITLFTTTTAGITLGGASSGISLADNTTLPANKTLTLNTTGGKILCNVYTGIGTSSDITLGESGNTGNLLIYKTINTNITLGTGIQIIFTSTGQMAINTIRGVAFADTISLYLSQTGAINFGNTASTNPLTINNNTTLATGRNITLSSTGKILCNTLTGTATSSTIEIGEVGDTGLIRTRKDLYIGSTPFGSNKGIYCNYFDSLAGSDTINFSATQTTGNINIQPSATSGNVVIGNTLPASDLGTLTINKNVSVATGKKITTPAILVSGLTASKMVLTDGSDNLVSSAYTDTDFVLKSGSSISGTLNVNDIQGTTTSSNITLFTNTSGALSTITISNTANLGVICNSDLFVGTTKSLGCNNIYSRGSSDLNINTFSSVGYFINLQQDVKVSTDKTILLQGTGTLTTSNTGAILSTEYKSTAAGTGMAVGSNLTTGGLTLAGAMTLANVIIGNLSNNNPRIYMYNDLWAGTTATNRTIYSNTLRTLQNTDSASLYNFTTTGSLSIGTGLTSGNLTLSNTSATGKINCDASVVVASGKDLTMSSSGYVYSRLYSSITASDNVLMFPSLSSGSVSIGDSSSITPFTGGTQNNSYFSVRRYLNLNPRYAFTNVGYGDTTTPKLFLSSILANKYLTTTMYATAPSSEWCSFESDTAGEGSAFIQNGDTSCVINPGDQSVLWWLDEDTIQGSAAGSTTYAWSGWKISTAGAFTTSSDRRLKRDITPIIEPDILNKLSRLEIVNYKWKPPSVEREYKNGVLRRKYQEIHKGYIAQEVREIFPDVVERETPDAYWTIKREDLSQYFHLGVQALIKQNKAQQTEIDDLKSRLARLEQLLIPTV